MNKTLIILTPGFAEHEQDSSTVPYLQDLMMLFAEKIGADRIKIVTTQYPYTTKSYLWKNISVYPIGGKNRKGLFRLITFMRTVRLLRKICTTDCIVHAFWLSDAAAAGGRIAKQKGLPFFVTLMGQDVQSGNRYFPLLPKETTFLALSAFQRAAFQKNYPALIHSILPLPLPDIQVQQATHRSIDILFTGSFIPVKQPELFVEIIAEIKKKHPGIRAVMIGGGALLNKINDLVIAQQLENNILLRGPLPRADVFASMQRARILLHTSRFEGQCLVFGEALLSGMHVVSFPVGRHDAPEKHFFCQTTDEFVLKCMELLSHPVNFTPRETIHSGSLINTYLELYLTAGK